MGSVVRLEGKQVTYDVESDGGFPHTWNPPDGFSPINRGKKPGTEPAEAMGVTHTKGGSHESP